jgi:SAM-dependent methyltransferase
VSNISLYSNYSAFKGWSGDVGPGRPEDFRQILLDAGLTGASLTLMDYGFGSGDFLDWARGEGHKVIGLEILPDMIAAAAGRGHNVHPVGDADAAVGDAVLDAIVSLDVLEHLDHAAFQSLMALARRTLKPGGLMIVRFPNGASPFSGPYQTGDLTHSKPLSTGSVGQWAAPEGMSVVRKFNPRSIPPGLGRALKRRANYLVRDVIEIAIGYVYLGYRIPMDPNVAVVLKRTEEAGGH